MYMYMYMSMYNSPEYVFLFGGAFEGRCMQGPK